MKKVILGLYLGLTPLSATSLPSFSAPFCPVRLSAPEKETEKFRLVLHINKASQRKYFEIGSLWDPAYLENNPDIVKALQEFMDKNGGNPCTILKLTGKQLYNFIKT